VSSAPELRPHLADVAPRLAKLLPRLGSNHDGEIVATVQAIIRTLAAAGLDLHALAAALAGDDADQDALGALEMLARLLRLSESADYALSAWEKCFPRGCQHRLRSRGALTEKQRDTLREIFEKVRP
jgi:hypothetical protein